MEYQELISTLIQKGVHLEIDAGERPREMRAVRLRMTNGRPDAEQFGTQRYVLLDTIGDAKFDIVLAELNDMHDRLSDHLPSNVDAEL